MSLAKKLGELFLTGCLALASFSGGGCSNIYVPSDKNLARQLEMDRTYQVYRQNFRFVDWNDLYLDDLPKRKLMVSRDLKQIVSCDIRLANRANFEKLVDDEIVKLGLEEKIKHAEPKQLIIYAADILRSRMDYEDVDNPEGEFAKKFGLKLAKDRYFELGKGDCDKYSLLMIPVFEILKSKNSDKRLDNVYMCTKHGCIEKELASHMWNRVIVLYPEKIACSDIDITAYDSNKSFNSSFVNRMTKPADVEVADFYFNCGDSRVAEILYKTLVYKGVEVEHCEKKLHRIELARNNWDASKMHDN